MKKIVLLVLLALCFVLSGTSAEWIKCNLTYLDGTIKTGFIKSFSSGYKQYVSFKTDPNAKAEKILSNEIQEITFISGIRMMHLSRGEYQLNKTFFKSSEKYWYTVVHSGRMNVLETHVYPSYIGKGYDVVFFNWPGEDYAMIIFSKEGGLNGTTKRHLRNTCIKWFKEKCDKMVNELDSGVFQPENADEVVNYFEKNCGE